MLLACLLILLPLPGAAELQLAIHRGDRTDFPENTIVAFQNSVAIGVDMIDTDVWFSQDGELMIFHDLDMCRFTTNIGD
jgi:glycerophosphoryl diester phosphodiesterase